MSELGSFRIDRMNRLYPKPHSDEFATCIKPYGSISVFGADWALPNTPFAPNLNYTQTLCLFDTSQSPVYTFGVE